MQFDIQNRLGFMQGRLSPIVDGKIQAFPTGCWQEEFPQARSLGLPYMEWTLDHHNIVENPLLSEHGRKEIRTLSNKYNLSVKTLTGDFVMQAPFYKVDEKQGQELYELIETVLESCSAVGIDMLVIPLVDNGSLNSERDKKILIDGVQQLYGFLNKNSMKIVFESDYAPAQLADFMQEFDSDLVGVNYDIGNSAALGYDWKDEMSAYRELIMNVHIKDRKLNDTTVPLGEGDADIHGVIQDLEKNSYNGLYIFQTARSSDDNHQGVLKNYMDFILARGLV